jgi:hypothetical protein
MTQVFSKKQLIRLVRLSSPLVSDHLRRAAFAAVAAALPLANGTAATSPPSLHVSKTAANFTSTAPNVTNGPNDVYLTNNGSVPVVFTSIQIVGDSSFTLTHTCPINPNALNAFKSCTVAVSFTPNQIGSHSATLEIYDNVSNSPQTVALSGTSAYPTVYLSSKSWQFGATAPGTTAGPGYLFITNSSPAKTPMSISGIQFSGGDPTAFSMTNTCPAVLAGAATCQINLYFSPEHTGVLSTTIQINDDSATSPQTIPVQGWAPGPGVVLSTTSWNFGPVPATTGGSTTKVSGTIYITNNGSETLTFVSPSPFSLTPTSPYAAAQYSIGGTTCGATLGINQSCSVTVTYTSGGSGVITATLNIADDALPATQTVTFSAWSTPGN